MLLCAVRLVGCSHLGGLPVGDVASELLLHGLNPFADVWVLNNFLLNLGQSRSLDRSDRVELTETEPVREALKVSNSDPVTAKEALAMAGETLLVDWANSAIRSLNPFVSLALVW